MFQVAVNLMLLCAAVAIGMPWYIATIKEASFL